MEKGLTLLLQYLEQKYVADASLRVFKKVLLCLGCLRIAREKVLDFLNRSTEAYETIKQFGVNLDTYRKILILLILRSMQVGMVDLRNCLTAAGSAMNEVS